jgi:hypothetical protein
MVYSPLQGAISSAGERCLHTAEVAGSNPASPTPKSPANCGIRSPSYFRAGGFVQQPCSNPIYTLLWLPLAETSEDMIKREDKE